MQLTNDWIKYHAKYRWIITSVGTSRNVHSKNVDSEQYTTGYSCLTTDLFNCNSSSTRHLTPRCTSSLELVLYNIWKKDTAANWSFNQLAVSNPNQWHLQQPTPLIVARSAATWHVPLTSFTCQPPTDSLQCTLTTRQAALQALSSSSSFSTVSSHVQNSQTFPDFPLIH